VRIVDDGLNGPGGAWIMQQFKQRAVPPYRALLAVDDAGQAIAGVVFHGYNGANVDLTAWAPTGWTRAMLRVVFGYAFETLHATRITVHVRRGRRYNPLIRGGKRAILARLGFTYEATLPRWYGDGEINDAHTYRMLRENCPWIARPLPQEAPDGAAREAKDPPDRRAAKARRLRIPHSANGLARDGGASGVAR
jgi:hypothetical protein